MTQYRRIKMSIAALLVFLFAMSASGAAKQYVDLELVLAVDVSRSMDLQEQKLQREGYVAAFRDEQVHKAIRSGPSGRIAVTYFEWAGPSVQSVVMPWSIISTKREAMAFADSLAAQPISRARRTSISAALRHAARLLKASPYDGLRRVIDVSGDGPNNMGGPVDVARDDIVSSGTVINGLAIVLSPGSGSYSYFDLSDLDRYYKDCVIGGPGSFVLSIKTKAEFATAIRQKLLLEIAGLSPSPHAVLHRTQFRPQPRTYDCLVGEKRRQQFLKEIEDW